MPCVNKKDDAFRGIAARASAGRSFEQRVQRDLITNNAYLIRLHTTFHLIRFDIQVSSEAHC